MNQDTIYKIYSHNPPHLFVSGVKYFITGATYLKKPFLRLSEAKLYLLKSIRKGSEKYKWILEDWVILDNHYHLMLQAPDRDIDLSRLMNEIHRFTGLWIKKNINGTKRYKKIFHNYWDTCITYESSYFARLNYIWFNPVKHNYVDDPKDYLFGSYCYRIKGEKIQMEGIKKKYRWDKINVKDDF